MVLMGRAHLDPPTSPHGVTVNSNVVIDNVWRCIVLPSLDSEMDICCSPQISIPRRLGVDSLLSDLLSIKYELFA